MLQFIITTILMASVGTMLYLIARSLPRIGEEQKSHLKYGILDRWVASEIPERIDSMMAGFTEKFLRKTRLFLSKVDNSITERLKKTRARSEKNGKSKIGFFEFAPTNGKEELEKKEVDGKI
ncbi:MAG: hypothetical protein AAB652_02145 [Patescibacteria group bacterium]